jgi:tripartite-type tricarboxylate transporter receptor subunit TctC
MAPAGTPPEIVARLNSEVHKILAMPDIKERFTTLGAVVAPGTPEDLTGIMRRDHAKWARVIKEGGIKLE